MPLPGTYKIKALVLFLCHIVVYNVFAQKPEDIELTVPAAGNTWQSGSEPPKNFNGNISQWSNPKTVYTTYIRTDRSGLLTLHVHARVPSGNAQLLISVNGKPFPLFLNNQKWDNLFAGAWVLRDTGYHKIEISGTKKEGPVFADIDKLVFSGAAVEGETVYTPNNEGNFFYWGRRGPSVHLNYKVPAGEDIEWMYTEITVPKGMDPVGSYFMADGFSVGYFGFQVNSATERHVLFSVWSPYTTDNPGEIPEDQKIRLLKKGDKVYGGAFGGEGSGGQSYLNYPWKPGITYKFLLQAHPNADSTTDFTAYFYAPESKEWKLIASFRRPHTFTWLTGLHSFLENFDPEKGNTTRKALYGNQWVKTAKGQWIALESARFTGDNTARKNYRKDYAGGVEGNAFYLKNGGFFNTYTPLDTLLTRPVETGKQPDIDLNALP